jgi:hypothetical protein
LLIGERSRTGLSHREAHAGTLYDTRHSELRIFATLRLPALRPLGPISGPCPSCLRPRPWRSWRPSRLRRSCRRLSRHPAFSSKRRGPRNRRI